MAPNPFLNRSEKKGRQSEAFWRSKKQEKELSKRLGGNLIIGSGNKIRKGDLSINGVARIEAKTTSSQSFRVTKDMLTTIRQASITSDQIPAIIVEFLNDKGLPDGEVAIISTDMLELLIHDAKAAKAKP